MKKQFKFIFLSFFVFAFVFSLFGCSSQQTASEKTEISMAVLKGPTGIGTVWLMDANDSDAARNHYQFQVLSSPDEAMAKLIQGEIDIAALPTNVAATVYNKSEQEISVCAVNTLGVLSILERGDTIDTASDLAGKTIFSSGQGSVPEYALEYLLEKNGIENVTVEYMTDHAELAAAVVAGNADIALLPEPNVTAVLLQNTSVRKALDLTELWNQTDPDTQLVMGCIVARKDFIENNPQAFSDFLEEYEASVDTANSDVAQTALLVEQYGIMDSAAAAEKAIPNCNIVFLGGQEMKNALEGFYTILFDANPKSIGGALPDEAFYYTK